MSYVPIYTNSAYTLMNSTVKVNEYIDLAQKMGYQRLGLIDEDTLSGALTFYQSCLKANIQPIIGLNGSFTVELKYFRSMPWYKAIFLSNFFNFTLVLFRTLWYNRVG